MFNLLFRPYVPGFRVRPQDDVPGFNIDENGLPRGASAWSGGMFPALVTQQHPDVAQTEMPNGNSFPTPGPENVTPSASPIGLAGFRARPQDDVPGFKYRLENAVPGFNLVGSGSGVQRQETNWSDGTRPESAPPQYSDTAPTLTPPGVEDLTQPVPSQLPEWLYKLVTMPLPQLSTAFDPRTGRRIVPYAPLIDAVRSYLPTDQNASAMNDADPYADGISPLPDPDSVEAPSAEPWPPSDTPEWPADINTGPGAATEQNANPEPTPQAAIWNAWPQPPIDSWPDTQAGGAELQVPWPAATMPQPMGVPSTLSVRPVADSNFIPANAGDAGEPQAQQQRPLPQDRPTEPKFPVTPSRGELGNRSPEHRTQQEPSRFIEQYQRTTADLVDDLASAITRFGERFYHDSILKPGDDLARLAERFADDPVKTTLSVLNSFPQTRIEGEFLASFAAVFTILANAKRGIDFEKAVLDALNAASTATKIEKNTTKIGVEGVGRSVPDILLRSVREIKSGLEIDNSIQLKVQAAYAKATGVPFSLIVSPTTRRISQTVQRLVQETGGTIQRFDPATGTFTSFK